MRSAPAPDLLPIPGMNQGTIVAGGGGGSGDGDGSGGDGDGKDGANGGDGGNDAEGDGRDGDGCGAGTGAAGCPRHGTKPSAGDPIDVMSGRVFTWPATDLVLPGPSVLVFQRRYSSSALEVDVGMGWGWSHTFAWRLEVGRTRLRLFTERGVVIEFDRPKRADEMVWSREGWTLWQDGDGYLVDAMDAELRVFRKVFESSGPEPIYALTAVRDHNDNTIALEYSPEGRLAQIRDSAGRIVRVKSDPHGRMSAIEVRNAETNGRWIAFARYSYDDRGRLVTVTDADGYAWSFTYDDDHRLTSHCDPEGLRFHFRYDRQGRGVESWGDYDGRVDPSLAADVPKLLADGVTRARGILHVKIEYGKSGYREVADSVQVQRFFVSMLGAMSKTVTPGGVATRELDQFGYVRALTDEMGATTTYVRDERGRLLGETDPLGRTRTIVRDDRGQMIAMILPDGGRWEVEYDSRGNKIVDRDPTGAVTRYEVDRRGMMTAVYEPNGAVTRFTYDAQGNLVSRVTPNGATWTYGHDAFGRIMSIRNPLGAEVSSAYTDAGRVTSIVDADGGVSHFRYDGSRRLVQIASPTGNVSKWEWGGFHQIVAHQTPTGDVVRYRYNREGWLTELHNERGEVYSLKYDLAGWVIEERTFAGRVLRYTRDPIGRVTRSENGAGEVTAFEYNPAGELVKKTYPDESEEEFFYDPFGRPIGMKNGVGEWRLERDLAGNILRELHVVDGTTHTIDLAYDGTGRVLHRATSLGLDEQIQRDAMGGRVQLFLDQQPAMRHERDAVGGEIARLFPRGGRLDLQFDVVDCLRRLRVTSPSASGPTRGFQEPEWVGAMPPGGVIDKAYRYNPAGELLAAWDGITGAEQEFDYDGRKRLLTRKERANIVEAFRYDPTGNQYEVGGVRQYAPGDVLVAKGNVRYGWDDDGRLIEKRVLDPLGKDLVTKLGWDGAGRLSTVELPDGSSVGFDYDPLGRRVRKRVYGPRAGGKAPLLKTVRFVWNGDRLAHEITRQAAANGDPVVSERTYSFDDDGFVPCAHRDTIRQGSDEAQHGEWLFYVTDHNGTTDALVRADGSIACEMQRTVWGTMRPKAGGSTSTSLRFQGQYEDEETGLFYNRFRYYDPDAGRYVSADPIGLQGGDNLYAYTPNPVGWVDPLGLHTATAKLDGSTVPNPNNGGAPQFNSGYNGQNNNNDPWVQNMVNTTGKTGRGYRESHSEFGIMRQLAGEDGVPKNKPPHLRTNPDLEGKTLKINGQSRSCPSCAKALEKFAQNNKMKIEYTGGGGKPAKLSMDYRPPDQGGTGQSNRKEYSSATAASYGK